MRAAVERVEIETDVSARDRHLDQLAMACFTCAVDRVKIGRAATIELERLVHAVLGGHIVHE